jgi:Family of unknown function (DUF6459)
MPVATPAPQPAPTGLPSTARLRVRPAPRLDPPFEDECDRPPAGMDMLPLPGPVLVGAPRGARRPPSRHSSRRPGQAKSREQLPRPGPEDGCSGREATRRFVGLCVEVINGFRPVSHLRKVTGPQRFADVADQILRRTARLRKAQGNRQQVRVRRIQMAEPRTGVVEAAAVLDHGGRCWAMAIRLERGTRGWECVVIQVI